MNGAIQKAAELYDGNTLDPKQAYDIETNTFGGFVIPLGEYGIDSQREGEAEQAAILERHLHRVFHHGLAGSVVFAYTDDWFTGGHQIEDWAFGVTRRDRSEKPAAAPKP